MGVGYQAARFLHESRAEEAQRDAAAAWFELGICYSSGTGGTVIDLVEAHKWFNLAAMSGLEEAQQCRTEIACDMTPGQIAAAQKAARAFLQSGTRAH